MRAFSLTELVQPLAASLVAGEASFDSVCSDTRELQAGQLFVALSGENFDGNKFVAAAAARGAAAALVSAPGDYAIPTLTVADTRQALGRLAALNRAHFTGTLIGITGSSGKTTVKNMIASILQRVGATLATAGNFNNEIGVPLTLLQLRPEHRYAVLEMGAARAGDIEYLCRLAAPQVSVLLNALPAHLEGFGSVAAVASAKGEILSGIAAQGTAVFNADSEYAELWRELAGSNRCLDFGLAKAAVSAANIAESIAGSSSFTLCSPLGEIAITLPMPGRHNIYNALAAAAACLAAGVELTAIQAGLASVQSEPGRLQPLLAAGGVRLFDDSYNANPGSVRAAIDVLAALPGKRWLLLGEMRELGPDSAILHRAVGEYAAQRGIDCLWAVGAETATTVEGFGDGGRHFSERDALCAALGGKLREGDVVLVKGSRSTHMETVVAAVMAGVGKEG